MANQNTYLTTNGGNSSKQTIFKLVTGGTATNCSIASTTYGTTITTSSAGTCLVYAVKPADNNYYPVVSPVSSITFESYTAIVQTYNVGGSHTLQIAQGPMKVDTGTPAPDTNLAITSISPTSGPVGTVVTITGTGFNIANHTIPYLQVGFGGDHISSLTFNGSTQITFTVSAASTSGPIIVWTSAGDVIPSPVPFTVTTTPSSAGLTIASFTPTSGPTGTTVTVTGTGFVNQANVTAVTINGMPVASYTVVSDSTLTLVTTSSNSTGDLAITTTSAGTVTDTLTPFTQTNESPRITLSNTSFTLDTATAATTANTYSISSLGGPFTSFTLTGTLPAGLTLNSSTGLLSGTPTEVMAATTYTITATAASGTASATFTLTTVTH